MTYFDSDRAAIRQIIRALLKSGHTLAGVDDGGEELIPVKNETEAIDAIMAVDQAWLFVQYPDRDARGWVFFVLGNDPEEVACDYTVGLSPVLDPLTESWWSE